MSKLPVTIDYMVAKTVLVGMKSTAEALIMWIDKMIDLLDKAVREGGDDGKV